MKILHSFGFGGSQVLAQGKKVTATVTEIKVCWWLKINTKPVRTNTWDGAVFPHMVHFEYEVNGKTYTGMRYWSWRLTPPARGAAIEIRYDPDDPAHYALDPR